VRPLLAVLLFRQFHSSMAIAAYMAVCSVISLAAVKALPDRRGTLDHR